MRKEKQTISKQLAKCPFCGGKSECYTVQTMQLETGFVVKCKNPDCIMCSGGTLRQTQDSAIEAWNTRKPMENIVKLLEEELELSDRNKRRFI